MTLNYWDYLEVATGLERGMCKRITITFHNNPEYAPNAIAKVAQANIVQVAGVRQAAMKWKAWVERRKGKKVEGHKVWMGMS